MLHRKMVTTLDRSQITVEYFRDFVKPHKNIGAPQILNEPRLKIWQTSSGALPPGAAAEDVQTAAYAVGKNHEFDDS